jgi:hypothetical protein
VRHRYTGTLAPARLLRLLQTSVSDCTSTKYTSQLPAIFSVNFHRPDHPACIPPAASRRAPRAAGLISVVRVLQGYYIGGSRVITRQVLSFHRPSSRALRHASPPSSSRSCFCFQFLLDSLLRLHLLLRYSWQATNTALSLNTHQQSKLLHDVTISLEHPSRKPLCVIHSYPFIATSHGFTAHWPQLNLSRNKRSCSTARGTIPDLLQSRLYALHLLVHLISICQESSPEPSPRTCKLKTNYLTILRLTNMPSATTCLFGIPLSHYSTGNLLGLTHPLSCGDLPPLFSESGLRRHGV